MWVFPDLRMVDSAAPAIIDHGAERSSRSVLFRLNRLSCGRKSRPPRLPPRCPKAVPYLSPPSGEREYFSKSAFTIISMRSSKETFGFQPSCVLAFE